MKEHFQIQLSSQEVAVVAALLGYESVFGVEDFAFLKGDPEIKKAIQQIVENLEQKKWIRYDLNGTLLIVSELRKIMDCVCNADTVGLFSTNLNSGKKGTVYILEKNHFVTQMERGEKGRYRFLLTDSVSLEKTIPREIFDEKPEEIHEKMPLEEAEYIRRQIESFDHEAAENRIRKYVRRDDSASMIAMILSGTGGYLRVQIHHKEPSLYRAVYNAFLVPINGHAISLCLDANNILCFDAIRPERIVEQIGMYLGHRTKGEDVQWKI